MRLSRFRLCCAWFLFGVLLVFPIMFIQYVLAAEGIVASPAAEAFLSAALLEEFVKWFVV